MPVRSGKRELLKRLLRVIVEEYGAADVEAMLANLSEDDERNLEPNKSHEKIPATAVSSVEDEEIDEPRRSRIMTLAEKFDSKTFLPRIGDIKRFIEIRGTDAKIQKRAGAFKVILPLLLNMSEEEFAIVERDAENSGPAELGPLSKAIRESSEEAVRRTQKPDKA